MKSFVAGLVLVMLSVISTFGQNTKPAVCKNETVEKISSRGINIGANINDVRWSFCINRRGKQRIRNSYSQHSKLGYEFIAVSPNQNPKQTNELFAGISDYNFSFLDSRLTGFSVSYNKPKWRNTEQFAGKMAEIFGLPSIENWILQPNGTLNIQCGDYLILTQANFVGERSSFTISDEQIGKILEQRKQKAEDEQREKDLKTFKP